MVENNQIEILSINNRKVVRSFQFYKVTGLKARNYTRWLTSTALELGQPDKDYFPAPGNIADRLLRRRDKYGKMRYYFDIEFAIALCLVAKRKEALALRDFLIGNK
jgi:phage anti-repressor protein